MWDWVKKIGKRNWLGLVVTEQVLWWGRREEYQHF